MPYEACLRKAARLALGSFCWLLSFDSAEPRLPELGLVRHFCVLSASIKMWGVSRRSACDFEASRGRYGGTQALRIEQCSNLRQVFEPPSLQARTSLFVRARPLRHAPLPRPPSLPACGAVRTYLFNVNTDRHDMASD